MSAFIGTGSSASGTRSRTGRCRRRHAHRVSAVSDGGGSLRGVFVAPLLSSEECDCSCHSWIASLVRKHLGAQAVDSAAVVRLLEYRAIPAGTPVFLDEMTMLPIEPLCSWFRHLAYDDKDAKTLREYAYIVRRFVHFLQSRGRDLLDATESDFQAYRILRTQAAGQAGRRCDMGEGSPTAQPALSMAGRTRPPATPTAADDPQGTQSADTPAAAGHGHSAHDLGPVPVLPRRRSGRAVTRFPGQQRVPRSSAAS